MRFGNVNVSKSEPIHRVWMLFDVCFGSEESRVSNAARSVAQACREELAELLPTLASAGAKKGKKGKKAAASNEGDGEGQPVVLSEEQWDLIAAGKVAEALEDLSLAQMDTLRADLEVPAERESVAEQVVIDGLDRWLERQAAEAVDRLAVACGLHPTTIAAARERCNAGDQDGRSFNDFFLVIAFPPKTIEGDGDGKDEAAQALVVQDWLRSAYEKNHADAVEDVSSLDEVGGIEPASQKRPREEDQDDGASRPPMPAADQNGDEAFVTPDNIERLMRESPSALPRDVLRANRKALTDPSITEFELKNHYLAAELKSFAVQQQKERESKPDEEAGPVDVDATTPARSTARASLKQTTPKSMKKDDLVKWILASQPEQEGTTPATAAPEAEAVPEQPASQ